MGIIIMGETGSGKTTMGKILANKIDFGLYEIGHEVKKVYLERIQIDNQENDLKNEKDYTTTNQRLKFTDDIVKKYGNDYYVNRILERQGTENIIIIGARSMAEIIAIKNKIKFPFFFFFTCTKDEIIRRFIKRESQFMTYVEAMKIFEERKAREEKWGVEDLTSQANMTISTEDKEPTVIANTILSEYIEFLRKQQENNKNIKHEEFER